MLKQSLKKQANLGILRDWKTALKLLTKPLGTAPYNKSHLHFLGHSCCRSDSGSAWLSARCLSSAGVASSKTVLRSPYPDVNIPNIPFAEFVFNQIKTFKGDSVAVSDFQSGRKYTFQQLKDYSIKVASALHKQGYRKGDVIASCTVNLPEFSILVLAAASLGIILSPANPAYTPTELSQGLKVNGACAMFTIPELLPTVKEAIADAKLLHSLKGLYTFGRAEQNAQCFNTLMEDDGKSFPQNVNIDPNKDILILPFSSGTTGLPKGVMLTHHNIVANILQIRQMTDIGPDSKILGLLPMFHIYGLAIVQFGSIFDGAELVVIPQFDQKLFLSAVQEKKITTLFLVPPIVLFLAKHFMVAQYDLSSVQCMFSGAAPLGEGLTMECQNRLKIPVYQGFGLTESPVTNVDSHPGHPGTIGQLVPNTEAKFLDVETGLPTAVGETGEYCVRGPQIMLGYYKNKKATDEILDKDGWLHTGDVGRVRDDGQVLIEDRLKELIKYKGVQVAPAELEGLLQTHPAVDDAAVIGIPCDKAGELPRAYIVLKPNTTATAEDICKFVEGKVSAPKRLRGGVEFIKEIPKSQSGKILRRILKENI